MNFFCRIIILLLLFLPSCSSNKNSLRDHKGSYLESAKLNFDAGLASLKDKDYEKAISYFQFVKSKYPFSQLAALSDLRIADVKFLEEKWLNAASMYEVFIRLHPRHEEVHYALFRVALSYFYAVPTDFFLLPPSTSRDQSNTKEALDAIERFVEQFPHSEHVPEALAKRLLLFSYLAKHNQHIANYYSQRGRNQASFDRHIRVVELYPETKEALESLYQAAKIADHKLNDYNKAIELYVMFIDKTKEGSHFEEAKKALVRLLNQQKKDEQQVE